MALAILLISSLALLCAVKADVLDFHNQLLNYEKECASDTVDTNQNAPYSMANYCMIKCTGEKMGILNTDGELVIERAKETLSTRMGPERASEVGGLIEKCRGAGSSVQHPLARRSVFANEVGPCLAGFKILDCFINDDFILLWPAH